MKNATKIHLAIIEQMRYNESNEEIEIQLSQVKNALETFLTSEVNNPYYNCPTELMLVYTVY